MTAQEWKEYGYLEYSKPSDAYTYAKAWKIGLSAHERKRRNIGAYAFSGRIGLNGVETKKYFKSVKQAKAYLLKYMQEN